ncbi:MAG: hypothetical protein HDS18_03165 [Bacteroides sp.]|nr:hypothetical protein [Bacteroidales bacterium]MBD5303736.1 hypothetical protein [Bacteroides sp.]
MKKYMKLLMVALFATLTFSLASCSDDDDDYSDGLSGVWEGRWGDSYESGTIRLEFKTSSKVIVSETFDQYPEDNYSQEMSYALVGNPNESAILKIWGTEVDGDPFSSEMVIKIDGKTMTCINEDDEVTYLTRK